MVNSIGRGAFGEISGDGQVAVKKLQVLKYDSHGTFYLKNEIANMILFHNEFDFVRVVNQGCYY